MEARFMAEKPDSIVFTMKITMPAKDWELLRDALSERRQAFKTSEEHWIVTNLEGNINDLLAQARKTFYPTQPQQNMNIGESCDM